MTHSLGDHSVSTFSKLSPGDLQDRKDLPCSPWLPKGSQEKTAHPLIIHGSLYHASNMAWGSTVVRKGQVFVLLPSDFHKCVPPSRVCPWGCLAKRVRKRETGLTEPQSITTTADSLKTEEPAHSVRRQGGDFALSTSGPLRWVLEFARMSFQLCSSL